MSPRIRCHCQSCTIRGLIWPVVIITAGVLFLLDRVQGGQLGLDNTYPVILMVIGLMLLAASFGSREGHVEAAVPVVPQAPPPPPSNLPQPPGTGQGQT